MIRINTGVVLISLCFAILFSMAGELPDKASPFTAVKWTGDQPVIRFEGDWYQFQSINNIPVKSIIDFCKSTYGDRWKKRFSEDFVEVLTKMGHKPATNVDLVLSKDGADYNKSGTMTEENRDMVRDFNNGEDRLNPSPGGTKDKTPNKYTETSSHQNLAKQMAEWMDQVWEADPPQDAANLRFLLTKAGVPFAGKIDIKGDFVFRAQGRENHVQAFNPNSNGRWVYEELPPGTYDLSITGSGPFDGWEWSKKAVEVKAGTKPLYEMSLDQ